MLDVILVVILYHRYLTTKKQMDTNSAFKKSMKLFFKIFLLPPLIYLLTHFIPSIKSPILPMAYKNNFSYLTKAERIGLGVLSNGFNLFYPVWIPYYYGITYYRYNFKKDEFEVNEHIKRIKNLCKKESNCRPYLVHLANGEEKGHKEFKTLLKSIYLKSDNKKKCEYYSILYEYRSFFKKEPQMLSHAYNDALMLHNEGCKRISQIAYEIAFENNDIDLMEKVLNDTFEQKKIYDLVKIEDHFISEFHLRKKIKNKSFFLEGEYRNIYITFSKYCNKDDLRKKAIKSTCWYIEEVLKKERNNRP